MKRLALTFSLVMVLSTQVYGQDPILDQAPPALAPAKPEGKVDGHTLTPEMYRNLVDLQRYGGPVDLTRERARLKAQQRLERMTALKWYGMSNSRPYAGATPFMGNYSPRWTSNSPNTSEWRDQMHYRSVHTAEQGGGENIRR